MFGVIAKEVSVPDYGPYSVGSSNTRVAEAYSQLSGEVMDSYLIGDWAGTEWFFIDRILRDKSDPLLFEVSVPQKQEIYGRNAGRKLPVYLQITYPTRSENPRETYDFPYANAKNTRFEHMQAAGEKPIFADEKQRYPLVFNYHGMNSHGFWSSTFSKQLSSHGYIVASVNFGDGRFRGLNEIFIHENLRPILAQAALDYLLNHPDYKAHIDSERIAVSGHSLGGYTALMMAGGRYNSAPPSTMEKPRIHAAITSAPWTGARWQNQEHYPFGDKNTGLSEVTIPVLGLYGSKDESVHPSFAVPAFGQLSGPRYVIELIDQPHIYETGSWQDQTKWILLFLSAYLKDNQEALNQLSTGTSMQGGGPDQQKFELQRLSIEPP